MAAVHIRPLGTADRSGWDRLYQGYAEFYRVTQTAEMRDLVWSWLLDPGHATEGLVADAGGHLVGLAHFRAFARPLSASTGGFLDDLFVAPGTRGAGVGEALIAAVKAEGQRRGWSVIRWITAADNATARSLYGRVATETRWVTYDIRL